MYLTNAQNLDADRHQFAGCSHPDCRASPTGLIRDECLYINIGRNHYGICEVHRTVWHLGSNLMSSWREQDVDFWKSNVRRIEGYSRVETGDIIDCSDIDTWKVWDRYR